MDIYDDNIVEFIKHLRSNPYINERQIDENISAFNFSRKAFQEDIWDGMTEKARGLFIDINNKYIVARGYDKFFAINERPETSADVVYYNLEYPVESFRKENGYLGLVSYDHAKGKLFIATKGSTSGEHAEYLRKMINNLDNKGYAFLYNYVFLNDVTLVFEVIDSEFDPHIVYYNEPKLVLLDIIYNEIDFRYLKNYDALCGIAKSIGCDVKKREFIAYDCFQLKNHILDIFFLENSEGAVIRDSNGFMFKFKTYKYLMLKEMRCAMQRIKKHGIDNKYKSVVNRFAEYKYLYEPLRAYVLNCMTFDKEPNILEFRGMFGI